MLSYKDFATAVLTLRSFAGGSHGSATATATADLEPQPFWATAVTATFLADQQFQAELPISANHYFKMTQFC